MPRATGFMAGVIKERTSESDQLNVAKVDALGLQVDVLSQLVVPHIVKAPPGIRTKVWSDLGRYAEALIGHTRSDQNDMDIVPINFIILTIHRFAAAANRVAALRKAIDVEFRIRIM